MKNTSVKIASAMLAASMALSFTACSDGGGGKGLSLFGNSNNSSGSGRDKTRSGQKISADSPWFESKIIDVDIPIDNSKELEYTYPRLAGVDDKYIVAFVSGYYKMPDGNNIDWENFNYNDYAINIIGVLDRNTNQVVNTIDLTKNMPKNGYIDNAFYDEGKITLKCTSYDDLTYSMTMTETDIDPMTGNELAKREIESDGDSYGGGVERSFKIGSYKIETQMMWDNDDNAYYILYVTSPDGNKQTVNLKEAGTNVYDVPVILPLGEDKAVVPASTDKDYKYYELDLKTLEVKPADAKEYSWIDLDNIGSAFTNPDGNIFYSTPIGISKIDVKNKKTEEVFNYSWCNVNRSILNYLELVECSDDSFVLAGEKYTASPYESSSASEFVVIEFDKAATNPHAGKTILEMYSSYGYIEDKVGEAIIKYNDSSSDYFIEVSDRYNDLDNFDYSNVNSEDDWENASLNVNASMSNALAMDILNGEGPDILMNVSELGQLNNPNYLADLTPYVGNLDSTKYFTNVIDASKTDGKLYHLPVCFLISGIQTDPKNAGASGVGFTTKEYEKFLNEKLNGEDVIPVGQAIYFTKLFSAMSDKFIVNGKADFSVPEFAEIAEYVKNNVRESSKSWDEMYDYGDDGVVYETAMSYGVGAAVMKGDIGYSDTEALYTTTYGISGYFMQMAQVKKGQGTAMLGIPSTDGRGPLIQPSVSVSVSAQAQNTDACGEFVKILLSDDVQTNLAMNDNLVLNREAFRNAGKVAIEYYNGEGGEGMFGYDWDTGLPTENRIKFSDKNIDDLEKIIESCSGINSSDASINLILAEEMQPYFLGQKSLEEVSRIAEDRVQKVIDERG